MASVPGNLRYTKEHEWTLLEDNTILVGITDFAQESLGDIVFVELPELGRSLDKDEAFGVVESIKSVSDLYSPVKGTVIEVNSDLEDAPEDCNAKPYDSWMIKLKLDDTSELENLLTAEDYEKLCQEA